MIIVVGKSASEAEMVFLVLHVNDLKQAYGVFHTDGIAYCELFLMYDVVVCC